MCVILFGGTFDPPHVGHLMMAQLALEQKGADAVWFLPAYRPPHKDVPALQWETRVALTRALTADCDKLSVCTVESELPTPSYTVNTVWEIQRRYPQIEFHFLLGTDSLSAFPHWHGSNLLAARIPLLVATRSGYVYEQALADARRECPGLRAQLVEMPVLDVSSSWLRDRWNADLPLCGLLPGAVEVTWRRWSAENGGVE